MKAVLALAAATFLIAGAARAADPKVDATVAAFATAFNTGDVEAAKALHVGSPVIVDEVAPHLWSGPNAFDAWIADLGKSETAEGKTGGVVAIGVPSREVVSGGSAYVIVPSTYTFKQKGATLREVAQMTFVLSKQPTGWKIAAWTWTGKDGAPVK